MAQGPPKVKSVMDPAMQSLANVYAEALLGLLSDEQAEEVHQELQAIVGLMDQIEGFEELLTASLLAAEQRRGLVSRVFAGRVSQPVEGFLAILARHDRLGLLRLCQRQFRKLLNIREGKIEVALTTAAPLANDQRQQIASAIEQAVAAQPLLETRVDERLLGGVVVRIGDRVYDASIAGQLKKIRQRLTRRPVT